MIKYFKITSIFFLCTIAFLGNAQQWQENTQGSDKFKKVVFTDKKTAFALYQKAEEGKYLLKSTDAGKTWTAINLSTKSKINDMCFLDNKTGFVVGKDATLLKTTDGGKTWKQQYETAEGVKFGAIDFLDSKQGIAIGEDDALKTCCFKTTDGGQSWTKSIIAESEIFDMIFAKMINTTTYFISGTGIQNKFLMTKNAGRTWTAFNDANGDISDIHFFDKQNGIASTGSGEIVTTKNGGKTWEVQFLKVGEKLFERQLNGLFVTDKQEVYLTGSSGHLFYSEDKGKTWSKEILNESIELIDIDGFGQSLIIVGKEGKVFYRSK